MMNRSAEEIAMREAVATWGREKWPRARLVHELVVTTSRIDMAFIEPDNIIGVEIKSSRDTLDRLTEQMRTFREHLPSVVLVIAPKWDNNNSYGADDVVCCDVASDVPIDAHMRFLSPRMTVTAPMLKLLWASEARAIAARHNLGSNPRLPLNTSIPRLARKLIGDEIVREVCRELRARDAFPKADGHPASDPPIFVKPELS